MTKKSNINSKKGFTIIEVALVLAIGGLIFLMVFTALPALQRSQRDSQRGTQMSTISTQINNYMSNNRGRIPQIPSGSDKEVVVGHESVVAATDPTVDRGTWGYFYNSYLINNSNGQVDSFMDPDGNPYSLIVQKCVSSSSKNGETCNNGQRDQITFDNQAAGIIEGDVETTGTLPTTYIDTNAVEPESNVAGHAVSILVNAVCDGEIAKYSTSNRKVAILYKNEGGGAICRSN